MVTTPQSNYRGACSVPGWGLRTDMLHRAAKAKQKLRKNRCVYGSLILGPQGFTLRGIQQAHSWVCYCRSGGMHTQTSGEKVAIHSDNGALNILAEN